MVIDINMCWYVISIYLWCNITINFNLYRYIMLYIVYVYNSNLYILPYLILLNGGHDPITCFNNFVSKYLHLVLTVYKNQTELLLLVWESKDSLFMLLLMNFAAVWGGISTKLRFSEQWRRECWLLGKQTRKSATQAIFYMYKIHLQLLFFGLILKLLQGLGAPFSLWSCTWLPQNGLTVFLVVLLGEFSLACSCLVWSFGVIVGLRSHCLFFLFFFVNARLWASFGFSYLIIFLHSSPNRMLGIYLMFSEWLN